MSDNEATREPYVFALDQSPFSSDITLHESRRRLGEVDADVVTDESGAVVAFLSEDDVDAVLTDRRFAAVAMPTLSLSGIDDGPLHDLWSQLMFGKDGTEHRRIRGTVAREFTPRAVEAHRDRIVDICSRMADRLTAAADSGDGVADLWSNFALPVSARVSTSLVGIPEPDADEVARWSFDLARAFLPFMSPEQRSRAEAAAVNFTAYMDELFADLAAEPGDDIASRLAAGDTDADLTDTEARALAANLVFGGLETTAKAISTGAFHLVDHGKWRDLVEDPSLIGTGVSELLRYLPPSPVLARLVPEDLVCQHVQLHAGQIASPNLLSACHDPDRYDDPDQLVLSRDPGKQLAFGAGAHYCLGASLAKLELSVAFETLTGRFPDLAVADPDAVEWDYGSFAGIVSLPVRLAP